MFLNVKIMYFDVDKFASRIIGLISPISHALLIILYQRRDAHNLVCCIFTRFIIQNLGRWRLSLVYGFAHDKTLQKTEFLYDLYFINSKLLSFVY